MKPKTLICTLLAVLLTLTLPMSLTSCKDNSSSPKVLNIVIPYTEQIKNIGTNYYIGWLEDQTGYDIQLEFMPKDCTEEYLRLLFNQKNSDIDGVFFFPNSEIDLTALIGEWGQEGKIIPLNDFIDLYGTHTRNMLQTFSLYDLERMLQAKNGKVYYMPSLATSNFKQNSGIFWINSDWLEFLSLPIPETTEELQIALKAFQSEDVNGNGLPDEVPLISSGTSSSKQFYNYIINAFVYNDPNNCRMAVENGNVYFAPATDQWRQAMIYCNQLYAQGLIPEESFTFSDWQLAQLIRDPKDLAGAFCSPVLIDLLSDNSSDFMEKYTHMAPLQGPEGKQYATVTAPLPHVGGVIPISCDYPKETFLLMDLMLSKEASLISQYGEEGIDWDFGQPGDVDFFSNTAAIHVKNQLRSVVQNKNLAGAGPLYLETPYVDSITFSGVHSDLEYLYARATMSYLPYIPKEHIQIIDFNGNDAEALQAIRETVDTFIETSIYNFITGKGNPSDDQDWQAYLSALSDLEIHRLTAAIQTDYDNRNR